MNIILSKITCLHTSGFGKSGTTQSGIHLKLVECDDICFVFDHRIVIVGIGVGDSTKIDKRLHLLLFI